jgi:putative transposase
MQLRKTLKYRLYGNRGNRRLHQMIDIAGIIWNQCLAAQRLAFESGDGYIGKYDLQKRVARLRRYHPDCGHWKLVDAQAVQQIVERVDQAYRRFFAYKKGETQRKAGRPRFKKVKQYRSVTLKQSGWRYLGGNKIRIGTHTYKFALSRPLVGTVKTVTVKRDQLDALWLCFSVVQEVDDVEFSAGEIGGFDFGMKTFLTDHEGRQYLNPQYFKAELAKIAGLNRQLSRKQLGSNNRKKAKRRLAQGHGRIANKRSQFHWQLAHELTDRFAVLRFEDLHVKGMQRQWGRKVSDLGFSEFMGITKHLCRVKGKLFEQIDRWNPSSQCCADCGQRQAMPLAVRVFACGHCGVVRDRDHNAALNIQAGGASPVRLGDVRRQHVAIPA